MRTTATALMFVLLAAVATPALAESDELAWKTFDAETFGFKMDIPADMKMVGARWKQWGGFRAALLPVRLWGIAKLGKKHTAAEIEAFGLSITKTKAGDWKLIAAGKDKQGFEWFKVQLAEWGKNAAVAIYGVGPKGSYLLVLKTTKTNYAAHKDAYAKWAKSVMLY